ncbi:MAG: hypothetical protein ABS81_28660 [Pseudonocardia sp. SCN 72-86]|nr:MAG: hypothetical protein ABS81_28660 [Pseudonocardia sp. SCN 72-86]
MPDVLDVTWRQVTRWRARRQLLTGRRGRKKADVVEVARRIGGLHSQVPSCGVQMAAVRGAAPASVEEALRDRTLVRTWSVRGTLHLLPADELGTWWSALTAREGRRRFPPSWEHAHGVTPAQLHAITDAVGEVLGSEPLGRTELAERIQAHLGDPSVTEALSTSWGLLLKPAAARGLLCFGPNDGTRSTFVSPTGWLGRDVPHVGAEEADRALLLRFLGANGPATLADVAHWWGEQPAPARARLRANADALVEVRVEGEKGFVVAADDADELTRVGGGPDAGDPPLLLPGFDVWTIAPRSHRRRALPAGMEKHVSRTAGWISPVLVDDGRIVATWEHELRGDTLTITLSPLGSGPLPAVDDTAAAWAATLGAGDVTITTGPSLA